MLATPTTREDSGRKNQRDYDLILCAPHFIGDGTTLHQTAHELVSLLSRQTDAQLTTFLSASLESWVSDMVSTFALAHASRQTQNSRLAPAFESRLQPLTTRLGKSAAKVNYLKTLEREIVSLRLVYDWLILTLLKGGHTLRREQDATQDTIIEEKMFPPDITKAILARCKAKGVTVNHALQAAVSVAWARCTAQSFELPVYERLHINTA